MSPPPHSRPKTRRAPTMAVIVTGLIIALAITLVAATSIGASSIAPADTLRFLGTAITGADLPREDFTNYTVITGIRLP